MAGTDGHRIVLLRHAQARRGGADIAAAAHGGTQWWRCAHAAIRA